MKTRINYFQTNAATVKAVGAMAQNIKDSSGLEPRFIHLVRLRASQINGCAFCLRMHSRDALAAGETADRLAVLPAWREADYFSAKERAGLALTEAITSIADGQLPDEVYAAAAEELNPAEIASVEWLAIVINMWNRLAISGRYPVKP